MRHYAAELVLARRMWSKSDKLEVQFGLGNLKTEALDVMTKHPNEENFYDYMKTGGAHVRWCIGKGIRSDLMHQSC